MSAPVWHPTLPIGEPPATDDVRANPGRPQRVPERQRPVPPPGYRVEHLRPVWTILRVRTPTLAHQGGWDEIGLVAVPIVIFAALLWVANRRANATDPSEDPGADPRTDSDAP